MEVQGTQGFNGVYYGLLYLVNFTALAWSTNALFEFFSDALSNYITMLPTTFGALLSVIIFHPIFYTDSIDIDTWWFIRHVLSFYIVFFSYALEGLLLNSPIFFSNLS